MKDVMPINWYQGGLIRWAHPLGEAVSVSMQWSVSKREEVSSSVFLSSF